MSTAVTLSQMLEAREERVRRQRQLLKETPAPLLCFTMNIAGPIKTSPLIRRGFEMGLLALEKKIPPHRILHREEQHPVTGSTAFWSVDLPAEELKTLTLSIEEATPLGRLFDMDVLTPDEKKLERKTLRGCIVCGAPGRDCAARRLHSVEELQAATQKILIDHFVAADANRFATLAVQSLLDEVHTTPKPGLVDKRNNGSHRDMNLPLFEKSANALRPYFKEAFLMGQATAKNPPEEAFPLLRRAGLRAEKRMFEATSGVNTHKGAIFTLGLLLGAMGRLWQAENQSQTAEAVCREAANLYAPQLQKDLMGAPETAGLRLYKAHGIKGIRGEAAEGFPTLQKIALPIYQAFKKAGLSQNDAGVYTLLKLIAETEDTNLYHRGGTEGACWAKTTAQALISDIAPTLTKTTETGAPSVMPQPSLTKIEELDDTFIQKNLSPGGSADLLAATYFLCEIINNKE